MKRLLLVSLIAGTTTLSVSTLPAAPADKAPAAPTTRPALAAASKPASAALPTEADIRAAFDAGDHPKTLQLLPRVLALKGTAAAAYNRYDLLMLKGESHLRLKQYKSAADAFGLAAKATEDEVQQATARATQRLVLEAKGPTIQQRSGARGGQKAPKADLLDPAQREDALRIAHADLRAAADPKVKAARRAHTLPPIVEALELVSVTRDFELAGVVESGTSGDTSTAARDELAERAKGLIEKEIGRLEADVTDIHERADVVVSQKFVETRSMRDRVNRPGYVDSRTGIGFDDTVGSGTITSVEHRRGLTQQDKQALKKIVQTCRQIVPTVESLAKSTGIKTAETDKLLERTKAVGRAVDRVLNTKY